MRDNDAELIADFMRTQVIGNESVLEVAIVVWSGPSHPSLEWRKFRTWATPPEPAEVAAAQVEALADKRFFFDCTRCGERCNKGHQHEKNTCHGCAERYLGVVH